MFSKRLSNRKLALLLSATLSTTLLIPSEFAFAAEESKSNESVLNYLESEDFIFTAERIPTNRWDTPANVHVITAEEIERNHYRSVDEALSHVNGVAVIEGLGMFHTESASGIGTHMVGGNRVLILIDGKRWFNPESEKQEAKAFTGIPSMKMIDRIEIVKGGQSALYGSDAFSGVINIITKKGTRNETTLDVSTGTWGRHQYELSNQGVKGKSSWFFTGKIAKGGYWDYKPSEYRTFSEIDDYKDNSAWLRFDQRFTNRSSLTFDYAHVTNRWSQKNTEYHSNNQINNFSLSYNFKEGTSTPGWFRYVHNYYSTRPIRKDDSLTRLYERYYGIKYDLGNAYSKLDGIEYQNGWEMGRHKVIAGLEYHKVTAVHPLFDYDNDMTTKSVYLQDTISFGKKWKVVPGVRYDHHTQFGGNWSPKIAANYRANNKTKVYATLGRSYNSPLSNELFSKINLYSYYYASRIRMGDEKLKPETGYTFITGVEHDFNDKSGMTFSIFANKIDNYLDWDVERQGSRIGLFSANHDSIRSKGIELTYRQKIDDHFSYNVGYSHTDSHFDTSTQGDIPLYRPQHNGYRLNLNYRNRGFNANLHGVMASGLNTNRGYWKYNGNTDVIYSYTAGRYAVLDLNLSYEASKNITFYFKALNLTNQSYSNYTSEYLYLGYDTQELSEDGEFWLIGPAYGKYAHHSPGRSFVFGVEARF